MPFLPQSGDVGVAVGFGCEVVAVDGNTVACADGSTWDGDVVIGFDGIGSSVRTAIMLLGDAAHAMSPSAGQGASLALEDAASLARFLRDEPDAEVALRAWERFRRPRVEGIARVAARTSNGKAPSALGGWFRDMVLPYALRFGARSHAAAYSYKVPFGAPT